MQQQQTVLRVQTNIPNEYLTYNGEISIVSATGWTISGSGTTETPYTGVSTSSNTAATFAISNDDGIITYDLSGFSSNVIYIYASVNGEYELVDYSKATKQNITGSFNISAGETVRIYAQSTGLTINSLEYIPANNPVYQYEFLDTYSDIPIKINKSFAELQDIGKRNSDYSIGLSLPGSKKNNRFFENFYNVDVDGLYFNPLLRVPCSVLIDDQSYFSGYMKLNKINVLNSKIEYDVTLFSDVADLFGKIGNNLLKDLDFNDLEYHFNHEFSFDNMEISWNNSRLIYDEKPWPYLYPIVHNGYEYTGDTVNVSGATSGSTRLYTSTTPISGYSSTSAAYAAGVQPYRINSPTTGIFINQLKPSLNIWNLIQLIFKTYGYSISSEFFNTAWFKALYMYGYFSSDTTKFGYKTQAPQKLTLDGVQVLIVESIVDEGSNYPCGTQYFYTIRKYDIYVVKAGTGIPCLCSEQINLDLAFKFWPCYGGSIDQTVPITIAPNTTGTTYQWTSSQFVDCGSGCPYSLEYYQNFVDQTTGNVGLSNSTLAYLPTETNISVVYEIGDNIDFNKVIDVNIKQIDILSSIAKKFNLIFIPDPETPNQIIIEPYNYYIGTGTIYDWTDKISYDKGITVEPALNYVESQLTLSDLEDGDEGNRIFKNQNNRVYGENRVYNSTDFKSQIKKIETTFSPELIRKWDNNIGTPLGINYVGSTQSINKSGSESTAYYYKGVKTKPKLFYAMGLYPPFVDQLNEVYKVGAANTYEINIVNDLTLTGNTYIDIPVISHTMPMGNPDDNKINNDSVSVLFNSEEPTDVGVETFNAYTENDAYALFYQNRVDNLYNPNTRFINAYFNLNLSDVQNLRVNDLIKIQEQYFTWNKIDGYNLTDRELTKVELIQTNNNPSTYPDRYFKYYYCSDSSNVYKIKTDMTNPNMIESHYYLSVTYDYYVGVLGGNVSGYTTSLANGTYSYLPYQIYEVTEDDYNSSGIIYTSDPNMDWDFYNSVGYKMATYWEGSTGGIIYTGPNIFSSCADFTSKGSAYGFSGGTITPPVTPTPTPTPSPTPSPVPPSSPMRGSLLMTFNELVADLGPDYYRVYVNSQDRDLQYTESTNLYSTFLYSGDSVEIDIITEVSSATVSIDVVRRDYTTDDQGGDNGIRDVYITGVTGSSATTNLTFTVQPNSLDYNFEYRVIGRSLTDPTPTPTATVTQTPTVTPTATPNAVCLEQIKIQNFNYPSSNCTYSGTTSYDRVYSISGISISYGYLILTNPSPLKYQYVAGVAPDGNYYPIFHYQNGSNYYNFAAYYNGSSVIKWLYGYSTGNFIGYSNATLLCQGNDFGSINVGGNIYFPQGGYSSDNDYYLSYPSVCPTPTTTPTPTPTISITPTNTLTPTPTPTLTPTATPSSGSTQAQAYIDAIVGAGATGLTATITGATVTLFNSLQSNGLYNKIYAMYPMLGGSAASCKFNAVNPTDSDSAFRLTFGGGWVFNTSGATPNGISAYADTHLTPSSYSQYSGHSSYYSTTQSSTAGVEIGAVQGPTAFDANYRLAIDYKVSGTDYRIFDINSFGNVASGTSVTGTTGYFITSRESDSYSAMYKNGSFNQSGSTATITGVTYSLYVGATNNTGTPISYTDRTCAIATIGQTLTSSEASTLSTIINTWATAVGRNTY